jgi:hypothetical protein
MNHDFREHVTSQAFCLTLTNNQVRKLLEMSLHPALYSTGRSTDLRTINALIERGLVERGKEVEEELAAMVEAGVLVSVRVRLTTAGHLVAKLLREAGCRLENEEQLKALGKALIEAGLVLP